MSEAITRQRLAACQELLQAAKRWLGPVPTPCDRPWLEQRQIELAVRALQDMEAVTLLAANRLWSPVYAATRMLIEDVAVAYWLTDHPDPGALEARWTEHLDASRLGDYTAQQELGLDVDEALARWHAAQDPAYLDRVGHRFGNGAYHWTGKSVAQMIAGAAGRGSNRGDWAERTQRLDKVQTRANRLVGLGLHHSPAASQNWYAPPEEMLPDALRFAWLMFGLHAYLLLEDFAPEHLKALDEMLVRQSGDFTTA
ncbi:MAG TPA: DUF5677 domain-containing protein [Pyrinomonadaceae bacterium]|jgi:hypothetical protein